MARRSFPIIYARDVEATASFYERLGFERRFQLPPEGEPGYVSLRRGTGELAVVSNQWPTEQYGLSVGDGVRFEMFIYVDDVDGLIDDLRESGVALIREAADMPWGERVGFVRDPDGNPVALAQDTDAP